MNSCSIDIVVPTYNSIATLDWTLLSLSKLNGCGIQARVIIVDSGSNDGTIEVTDRYGFERSFCPPGNMYAAINCGFKLGVSEWCTYINSDDLLYSGAFSNMVQAAYRSNADILYGNIDYIDADGRFLHSWNSASVSQLKPLFCTEMKNPIPQPGTVFTRKVYKKLGGFKEDFRYVSDGDFFRRACSEGAKFRKHNGTVAAFRVHKSQISNAHQERMLKEAHMACFRLDGVTSWQRTYTSLRTRMQNIPNYFMRIARLYQLHKKLSLARTLTVHEERVE